MSPLRAVHWIVTVALIALAFQASAHAQATYPHKVIRLVVPFPPASGTDIVGRLLTQEMSKDWSQPFIVDNRPGGSTIVGTEIVARSAPDGYTLIMASNNHAMNPSLFARRLPFDPLKDFTPVAEVAVLPFILVVNPDLPVENLSELLALARSKPGTLSFASTGYGTPPHVAGEMLKREANVDITHVPYKGSAAALSDLVSGQVSMMFVNVPSAISLVHAGKLRALAVGTSKRIAMMPELPTLSELGMPGFDVSLWMGLLAPAGTPPDVVDKLAHETSRVLADPAMREKLAVQGAVPAYRSPAEFSAFIADEVVRFGHVVNDIKLRVN